jgi:hypothetical protein
MPLNFSDWEFQGLDSELKSSDCDGIDGFCVECDGEDERARERRKEMNKKIKVGKRKKNKIRVKNDI